MITWAQAEHKRTYTLTGSAFNYVVQDLKDYLVSKGMTLIHSGYEWAPTGGDTGTTGSAGTGGQAFFVLQPASTQAYAKKYIVMQGVFISGGGLGLSIGACDDIPASWPGTGQVALTGYQTNAKLVFSSTNQPSGGYPEVGALCGTNPSDGLAGIFVIFGANQTTVSTGSLFVSEFDHGHFRLLSNSPKLVTYTIGGVAMQSFIGDSGTTILGVGTYQLLASCNGEQRSSTVTISKDLLTTVSLVFSATGLLDVTVNPAGTTYTLTGPQWPSGSNFSGTTLATVMAGSYHLAATLAGYRALAADFVVTEGSIACGGTFTMQHGSGKLRVTTTPTGAIITVT